MSTKQELDELQKKVLAFRDARDWKQFHNPKDLAISLLLEAAELLEHFQWKNPEEMLKHLKNNKEEIADELADVFYFVLIAANDFEIDLGEAMSKKLAKNEAKYPVDKSKGSHKKYTELL